MTPKLKWIDVSDSARIAAVAYDVDAERIYVLRPNGVEWWYGASPLASWQEFTDAATSTYQYLQEILETRPNGPRT